MRAREQITYGRAPDRFRPPRKRLKKLDRLLSLLLLIATGILSAFGQNFINNGGTVVNAGTFRVKQNVSGLPSTVGGTFDYFGGDQAVWARTYQNLTLTGSGNKTTQGGDVRVTGNITVAPAVALSIEPGSMVKFDGTLFENGRIKGRLQTERTLTAPVDSSAFGNIGVTMKWDGGPPGITTVTRHSDSALTAANGRTSIKRYYRVDVANSSVDAEMIIRYADQELEGRPASKLTLWRSTNEGLSWRRVPAVVDTVGRRIARPKGAIAGLYAISDSANALGSGGTPAVIAAVNPIVPSGVILTAVDSFTVVITDAEGTPVEGATVNYALTSRPSTDTSAALALTQALTDAQGRSATLLTLGHKIGEYTVTATTPDLIGQNILLKARATHGPPMALAKVPVEEQTKRILEQLDTLFAVRVLDIGENPVPNVMVNFSIDSIPSGQRTGPVLSSLNGLTDSSGRAGTYLTLGSKIGRYVVSAASTMPAFGPVYFVANALPGAPSAWAWSTGAGQQDTIGATLVTPFSVFVADVGDNAVPSVPVQFSFAEFPTGASEQNISNPTASTDANGVVSTNVQLGNKVGLYKLKATFPDPATGNSGTRGPDEILAGGKERYRVHALEYKPELADLISSGDTKTGNKAGPGSKRGSQKTDDAEKFAGSSITAVDLMLSATATHGVPVRLAARDVGEPEVPISTQVDSLFTVTVTDRGENPVPAREVRFAISTLPPEASGMALSVSQVNTGVNGTASTRLTVGNKTGRYEVTTTVPTTQITPVTFAATARPGPAARFLALGEGLNQVRPILTQLDTSFAVRILDAGGNGVPGVTVSFAVSARPQNATGDIIQPTSVTDNFGTARAPLTLGNKVGMYRVVARSTALTGDSAIFNARAIAGAPTALAADGPVVQIQGAGNFLNDSLIVLVRDIGENPVPYQIVTFALSETPANAAGTLLTSVVDTTDMEGRAGTRLKLGSRPGLYRVRATAGSITPVIFAATADIVIGDANNDRRYDIADLTEIIDLILGRSQADPVDSVRADVNGDGFINIADALLARDQVLGGSLPVVLGLNEGTSQDPTASPVGSEKSNPVEPEESTVGLGLMRSGSETGPVIRPVIGTIHELAADSANEGDVRFTGDFEITPVGVRFVLDNQVPVKGLEILVRFNRILTVESADLIFERAKDMRVEMKIQRNVNELKIVVWNPDNTPIEPGRGPLFRLPISLPSVSAIQLTVGIASIDTNISTGMGMLRPVMATMLYPLAYKLEQNYPNPFNATTVVEYEIPEIRGEMPVVSLQVFDMLGRKVRTLVEKPHDAGRYRVVWDGTNDNGHGVASGTYFYRLITGNHMTARKMVILK